MMRWVRSVAVAGAITAIALFFVLGGNSEDAVDERLLHHRNLGKAFYENPTTQKEAVEEFRKALAMAPDSLRERLNYGLALLRAGQTKEGIAELERVQKQDPAIPHTWFNLGIEYKKAGEYDRALPQFEKMVELVPAEAVAHYNLAVLLKLDGRMEEAIRHFETTAKLDSNLAAPHFQLYNAYRQAGRREDAARMLAVFQKIKKEQEGAAIPEDMEWSFYSEVWETIEARPPAVEAQPAAWKFQAHKLPGSVEPESAGLLALDMEGDGAADLLAWSEKGLLAYRGGGQAISDSGLEGISGVVSAAAGDFNNDGLTDLCVVTEGGPVLLANVKGKFEKRPSALPAARFDSALWLDYDHDYDLDLFLFGARPVLYRNQGEAGFADRTADFPFVAGHAVEGVAFRVIPDSKDTDLAVSHRGRAGVLYRDRLSGRFEALELPSLPENATGLRAADVDHDSWIDLAFAGGLLRNREGKFERADSPSQAAPVFADLANRGYRDLAAGGEIYRNQGMARFGPGTRPEALPAGPAWVSADFDADGKMDLAAVSEDGGIHRFLNQTETKNKWLRVALKGEKNLKLAEHAEVEVKAGGLYQKKIYRGLPLLFGLGSYAEADTVRITWPNGLIQNEAKQAAGRAYDYKEAQRLSGSCPIIWTWNGREFEYITDVLGVAPLGASAGDGEYFPVDHDEYIQIAGSSLAPRDGKYEIRITEELAEVTYLDHVRLFAVDHPAGVDLFTNDKFKGPPFPEFRLFGVSRRIYPRTAVNGAGRDVLARLRKLDRAYPDEFQRTQSGVAELQSLEMDFGPQAARGNRSILVLNGWVDWADGSTFLGASQEGRGGLIPPYLQVKDANGRWRTVIEDMGMPAGKPKTIVVDLSGKFLSASREVRIVTNLCVYWDEIFLSEQTASPEVRLTALDPVLADFRFRGFSGVRVHPERKQPEAFFYGSVKPTSMWNPTPGLYTRFGDVRDLVTEVDDRFVLMGSGDELRLEFEAAGGPPEGWRRDFLLLVDGWAKDRDPNTAYSQTVEPLPFHGMSRYPYPADERYPNDEKHREYRERYNTRPALRLIRPLAGGG